MPYSASTGIYTPASGATTATAGQTIASATWNNINNDYTTALTALGPANLPFINGGQNGYFNTRVQTANFGAAAGDIAIISVSSILPPGISTYSVDSLRIGNAQGNLTGVNISLYTAPNAGGVAVITSTATTVVTSLAGNANSYQVIFPARIFMFNSALLFLHISISNNVASLGNVSVGIAPVY